MEEGMFFSNGRCSMPFTKREIKQHSSSYALFSLIPLDTDCRLSRISSDRILLSDRVGLSAEPGYYEAGQFGIRLETIMFCRPAEGLPYNFSGPYLTFEPVTLVPFEPKLIKAELLSKDQVGLTPSQGAR